MENKDTWDKVKDNISGWSLTLGTYFSRQLMVDPKHVLFTFARYKFAAKLIGEDKKLEVLELGCNEGVGSLMLSSFAKKVVAVDFDERAIDWASGNLIKDNLSFIKADFLKEPIGKFDAVVSMDVIEHIPQAEEDTYLQRVCDNLKDDGFCVIGTPNVTASEYACEASKVGHINLFDAARLKALFEKKFKNVFIFGMNDEVVHTGFHPMCHFLVVLACNRKDVK